MIRHGLFADLLPVAHTENKFAVIGSLHVEPLNGYFVPMQPCAVRNTSSQFYGQGEPEAYKRLREALL